MFLARLSVIRSALYVYLYLIYSRELSRAFISLSPRIYASLLLFFSFQLGGARARAPVSHFSMARDRVLCVPVFHLSSLAGAQLFAPSAGQLKSFCAQRADFATGFHNCFAFVSRGGIV